MFGKRNIFLLIATGAILTVAAAIRRHSSTGGAGRAANIADTLIPIFA